jgi:amino acid transporter
VRAVRRATPRAAPPAVAPILALGLGPAAVVVAETNLQETEPLVWVLVAISVAGALITYGFLAYAVWRYRDPHVKGRRYG